MAKSRSRRRDRPKLEAKHQGKSEQLIETPRLTGEGDEVMLVIATTTTIGARRGPAAPLLGR